MWTIPMGENWERKTEEKKKPNQQQSKSKI